MKNIENVVVINDFDYVQGGASKVAIQTANLLTESKEKLNVYFFSAVHSNQSTLNEKVINVCTNQNEAMKEKNKIKGLINGIYNHKSKKELKKLLSGLDKKKTIVHIHGWTKALSSSVFDICWKLDFKVVLTMHDYFTACPNGGYFNYKTNQICQLKPLSLKCIKCNCDSRNYAFKIYRILRQFVQNRIVKLNKKLTDVISISDFSEKILKNTLNEKVSIHRVYNPIDIVKREKRISYKKNNYFLYVGRVSKEKGVDIFCEAITKANKKGIVVGDGEQKDILAKKYPNISFVGWKNSNEVRKYMEGAKALVFPSRWYETAGLTVLEAANYGTPSIVSSNTAATEFLYDKNNIFENSDVDSLTNVLKNFKTTKNEFNIENFSYNRHLSNLKMVYNDIINK